MSSHKTFSHQYIMIPRQSTVEAIVRGTSGNVRVTVSASGPGINPPVQANHPAAWNQTWQQDLARKGEYTVVVDIDFLAKANVDAELRVLDKNGNPFGIPWALSLAETPGSFVTLSLGLGVL